MTASIGVLEQFLDATFEEFSQSTTIAGRNTHRFHRATEYSLPRTLAAHIHDVFLAIDIPPLITGNVAYSATPNSASLGLVTPALLNSYYSITSNTGSTSVAQDVFASLDQTFSPSDLTAFQSTFGLPQQAIAANIGEFFLPFINMLFMIIDYCFYPGGHVSNSACSPNIKNCEEANLDVQYLMAISQVTPTTFYYWNGTDIWESFLIDLASRRGTSTTPLVVSISYASLESDLSLTYLRSFNAEALKIAAQGGTIIAASGDNGVNCAAGFCTSSAVCGYFPSFPASSPLVTAVGATQVIIFSTL